ncbi:MAG: insulinase family protein [Gammaproteobacteria bacterium]|nr:insulinase family protein [Gammaproteobacteria bacterium]
MRAVLIPLLTLLLFPPAALPQVHEYRLDNGFEVIIKEDHRAPIAVSQVWYKVGSSYEPGGVTGVSHALEHMMFKGTKTLAPGEFSRIIAANGGEENAFTSRDYTAYHQTLSADRLEVAFRLEADRMRNLTLSAEEFAKEIEVIKEERRLRTEDKPTALTYEQLSAVAYRSLPYANPVIGWMGDLEQMKVEDLADWYRLWYAPNNAVLVVVGDVRPEWVLELAKRYFGPLQPESVPQQKVRSEPPQRGVTRVTVRAPAREPYLIFGFKTPAIGSGKESWEPYALEMLASVLDGGSSARFSRNLVRGQEVAVSAGAGYDAFSRLPGMFLVDGTPAPGRNMAELEQALLDEIEQLQQELVSESELERIRTQVVANKIYELDSVFAQALQIGQLEAMNLDWRLADEYVHRMKEVTPEQVRSVARKYLVRDNMTMAQLEPLPLDEATSGSVKGEGYARHQ